MENYFSLIKNSEETHPSCLRTVTVNEDGAFYTQDKSVKLSSLAHTVCESTVGATVAQNVGDRDIDLCQLSAAFLEISNEGKLPWYDEKKYKIHFCQSAWLGEGQWNSAVLDDLGLYQVYDEHQHRNYASFSSKGSWSTARYYPLLMVEDLELGKTHYFEIKSPSSWYAELCIEYDERGEEALYVFLSDSCEKNDGWHKTLAPGEMYQTAEVVYGTVEGGFEAAVQRLTRHKRADSKAHFENGLPPVCFNDYMNCCWAMPSWEKTTALVDRAAALGVEVFCIDSGWQASLLDDTFRCIGDWKVSESRFSPKTFRDVVEYIKSKGMKCGAWLEIEGAEEGTEAYQKLFPYILKRRGHVIGSPKCFYDFRAEPIRRKIEAVFDMLYSMGIRYIKNDYNKSLGVGCDGDGSMSDVMRENLHAFLAFIDKMEVKYPDLIVENCGSGGMRCDSETLSHFHLQSTSDQEVYTCNPSILCGSLGVMPPEKAGIWAYPYPVRYKNRMEYKIFQDDYSDGNQTAFNMVNAMMGVMYLSGRVDAADKKNLSLIQDAIRIYKEIRLDYTSAYPIYPNGTFRLKDQGIFPLGLYVPTKRLAYIAVWKIHTDQSKMTIDLGKYGNITSAEKLYPVLDGYRLNVTGNRIKAEFPEGNCAMLVKIEY